MDLSKMIQKPDAPQVSGNYRRIWIALAEDVLTMPQRNPSNVVEIANDIVFKSGKSWIPFYVTAETSKLNETGSENPDNDNVKSVFTFHVGGYDEYRKQFIAEHGTKDMYVMIQKCGQTYPTVIGDSCSVCKMTWVFDEDEKPDGKHGVTFTFTRNGAYNSALYKGAVTNNNVFAADDATPSVADGSIFMTGDNTAATAITDLDDVVVGSQITILGGGGTNASTIDNSGYYSLSAAWTATVGTYIVLYVRADNDYVELERG